MARSATDKAALAAEELDAFLRDRPRADSGVVGPQTPTVSGQAGVDPPEDGYETGHQLRSPATGILPSDGNNSAADTSAGDALPLRLPHTDWLHHRMVVAGPVGEVAAFRKAAAGAGTIPWRLDLDSLEEDWFHRLIDPSHRQLSLAGARVLADQLRDAVGYRHAVAVSRVGRSQACPFDLHALVPVPTDILTLGPDHPEALAWLWQHWGTTHPLRHVAPETAAIKGNGVPPPGEDRFRLRFWSADWTPWRALAQIGADWPALRVAVQPDHGSM